LHDAIEDPSEGLIISNGAKEVGAGLRGTSASLERQFDDAAERTVRSVSFDGGR
jgi:hypothetical protein